ncbi:MAG: DMT family transporter [Cyanobacteria bacterium P01_E01_bin.42]
MQQSQHTKGLAIVALVLSLIAYAFVPILIRWSEVEISPEATIFNRCWMGGVILGSWKLLKVIPQLNPSENFQLMKSKFLQLLSALQAKPPEENSITNSHPQYLVWGITIIASVLSPVLWAWSLTQTTVANSALIHSLTPLFTTVGSWLVFKVQFEGKFWKGVFISVGGAIILSINDFQLDFDRIGGDLLALMTAISFAVDFMGTERLQSRVNSMDIVLWFSISGAIIMLLLTVALGKPLFPGSLQGWLAVATLAIVGQILGLGLVTYSIRQLSASLVALAFLLDPILTAIAAWFAFGETLNFWNGIAFIVVLSGIYLGLTAKNDF